MKILLIPTSSKKLKNPPLIAAANRPKQDEKRQAATLRMHIDALFKSIKRKAKRYKNRFIPSVTTVLSF